MNKLTVGAGILASSYAATSQIAASAEAQNIFDDIGDFFEHQFVDFWTDEFVDAFKDFGDWFTGDFLDFWENDFADWWANDFADFWTEDFVDFMTDDFVNFWTEDFVEFWSDGFVDLMLEDIPEALAAMPEAAAIYVVLLGTQALVSAALNEAYDEKIPDIPDWFTGDFVDSW